MNGPGKTGKSLKCKYTDHVNLFTKFMQTHAHDDIYYCKLK